MFGLAPVSMASPSPPANQDPPGRWLYVNFDGAELTAGDVDDAPHNISSIAAQVDKLLGWFPAAGGTFSDRQAVLQAVRQDWHDFDLEITLQHIWGSVVQFNSNVFPFAVQFDRRF